MSVTAKVLIPYSEYKAKEETIKRLEARVKELENHSKMHPEHSDLRGEGVPDINPASTRATFVQRPQLIGTDIANETPQLLSEPDEPNLNVLQKDSYLFGADGSPAPKKAAGGKPKTPPPKEHKAPDNHRRAPRPWYYIGLTDDE